jgi:DNA-binding IclR family transcriptional regulator
MGSSSYKIQSVLRALDLLIWLSENGGRGRLTDIATGIGCSKNTAFRLLYTLMERDFVRQADNSSYELTFRLLNLGEAVLQQNEVHLVARPCLQSLSGETGETTTLAILDGDEVIYLDRVLGSSPFKTSYTVGSRAKAHTTALGKAILAFSPRETIDRCLQGPLLANTPYTVTDSNQIRRELGEIARRFYAIDNQENALGVRCLGAPIFDHRGNVIAAISMSGLAVHFSDFRVRELADHLRETAASISERLGYRGIYASKEMTTNSG